MTPTSGGRPDCRRPAPGGSGGTYWTPLTNEECDPTLRSFPGSVLLGQRGPEPAHAYERPPSPRRPLAEEEQLQALCEWLHGHGLDLMGVVTFSDQYADSHGIYSIASAVRDVWRGLSEIRMHSGKGYKVGYPFKFVLAGEMHRTGRTVPHVHVALESHGVPAGKLCAELFTYFLFTRGRCRFEPMRDVDLATLYGLKDTVKASKSDPSAIAARLWYPRRRDA